MIDAASFTVKQSRWIITWAFCYDFAKMSVTSQKMRCIWPLILTHKELEWTDCSLYLRLYSPNFHQMARICLSLQIFCDFSAFNFNIFSNFIHTALSLQSFPNSFNEFSFLAFKSVVNPRDLLIFVCWIFGKSTGCVIYIYFFQLFFFSFTTQTHGWISRNREILFIFRLE